MSAARLRVAADRRAELLVEYDGGLTNATMTRHHVHFLGRHPKSVLLALVMAFVIITIVGIRVLRHCVLLSARLVGFSWRGPRSEPSVNLANLDLACLAAGSIDPPGFLSQ